MAAIGHKTIDRPDQPSEISEVGRRGVGGLGFVGLIFYIRTGSIVRSRRRGVVELIVRSLASLLDIGGFGGLDLERSRLKVPPLGPKTGS